MILSRPPRVLFISAWDGQDYGCGWMLDGLCELLGWRNVIEWPHNPYHHLPPLQIRQYDSELHYPRQFWDESEIRDILRAGGIDLVVLSSTRMVALGTYRQLEPWLHCSTTGLVVLDMEDSRELNCRALFPTDMLVRAVFKREWYPIDYGVPVPVLPLPFSYPASRAVAPWQKPIAGPLVFYHAHDWGWAPDSPRHRMAAALRERFGEDADVGLSEEGGTRQGRLSNVEYHQRLAGAKIAVALNEGGGSDNNRYWESVAHGCVLVSDQPRHGIPDNFVDGQEAFFYQSIEHAVEIIARLAEDDALRLRVATAGFAKFWNTHTTAGRARYLLQSVAELCLANHYAPPWVNTEPVVEPGADVATEPEPEVA